MKKIFTLIVLLFISTIAVSAEKQSKFFGFDFGFSSGIPFYGSSSVTNTNSNVTSGDPNRIIAGTQADFTFRLAEPIRLMFGTELLCDFIWSGSSYSNHLDYDFFMGAKIYPGFYGLNFSVSYLIGCRSDFINTEIDDKVVRASSWGNGFRLSLEYDFHYQSSFKCLPALGVYYKFVPRGDDYVDNVLAAYVNLAF